jgi:GTP-binding protein YchF
MAETGVNTGTTSGGSHAKVFAGFGVRCYHDCFGAGREPPWEGLVMNIGIIGYARSGKTTVFNALTGARAHVGAFGSRDANVAVLKVPDERVDKLARVFSVKKLVYAEMQFVDVAPSESGGEQKALDDAALNALKNADALVHVVRAFEQEDVVHPLGGVDPVRDCTAMEEELRLSDLIIIENRIDRLEKENRKDHEHDLLGRCREHIESGAALRTFAFSQQEAKDLAGFTFLSQKPVMLLGNYGEGSIGDEDPSGLATYAAEHGFPLVDMCGEMELEVAELPDEERASFRKELGLGEESRRRFLEAAFELLGLITFLTHNEKEVHAWTVSEGTHAVDAAGMIHSDIQRGFIRAEVINYADFMAAGSVAKAREHGHFLLEGKEYVVRDGDIILFRFNV